MKWIKGVHVWFLLSVAAALAVPPLLLRAAPDGFDTVGRRVQAMPQPERDRIERNFSEFLAMDETQRNHYRDMHRRLEEDLDQAQGIYAGQFEHYTAWLRTIEPHRREELRRMADSQERLELMHLIIEEESDREMQEIIELVIDDTRGIPMLRRARGQIGTVLLEQSQYDQLMRNVESEIDLSRTQSNELEELEGIERTFRLFKLLQERGTPLSRALTSSEIATIIRQSNLESLIDSLPGEFRDRAPEADQKRFVLMMVVMANVRKEYRIEVHEHRQPSEDDLRAFLNDDLSDDQRDNLLRLPPDQFRQELEEQYAAVVGDLDFNVITQGMFGPRPDGASGRPVLRPDDRPVPQTDAGAPLDRRPDGPRPRGDRQQRPRDVPPAD